MKQMRFGSIVPLAPHVVMSPVIIGDFELPLDTIVLGNLYAILHDPKVWPDAEHFNPEANFPTAVSSDEERELLACRMQSFIPFSVGKRACLGETLARQELFIFFVGLMQRFRVAASPEHPLSSDHLGTHGNRDTHSIAQICDTCHRVIRLVFSTLEIRCRFHL